MSDYIWDYGDYTIENGKWEQEKFRTLYTVCLKASNDIMKGTLETTCDLIADPATICALECMEEFQILPSQKSDETSPSMPEYTYDPNDQIVHIGSLGRFKVYRDMFAFTNYAKIRRGDKEALITIKGLNKSSLS